ncbi:MAG TPA: hypothetical protein VGL99_04535 [Chloroflexota bacterium]|jgi:hypothetical protein
MPAGSGHETIQQLHSNMMLGWETGIQNQLRVLRRWGFTRAQIMEIVMYSRLASGVRWAPRILKAHRALWEVAIQTLPKQVVPYLMLRDATLDGDRDALREAALLLEWTADGRAAS